ncbi:MAG TPA: asparaginase [Burkholderiaceae bacterium]|nr:asparaginase [Burkholderiaceae bacterium]
MSGVPGHVPLLATTRGRTVECVHYGSIAVCDRHGDLVAALGDVHALNFARSALKPVQALPFIEDDGPSRFGFGSHEVALMCASHSGEAVHVRIVRRMLARIGAAQSDLQCGCHPPLYYGATGEPAPPRGRFGALHHNCSGKHAGFLAYCRLHGHRLADYLAPEFALQVRIRNTVQRFAGTSPVQAGIDGCSAPTYALPLVKLAHTYAQLAAGSDAALTALRYAMRRHPDLVSGTARIDLALAQAGGGDWIAKAGADGVQAIGVAARGLGIAVRIADGSACALHTVTAEVLHQIGLLPKPAHTPLASMFRPALTNYAGLAVGSLEPLFELALAGRR